MRNLKSSNVHCAECELLSDDDNIRKTPRSNKNEHTDLNQNALDNSKVCSKLNRTIVGIELLSLLPQAIIQLKLLHAQTTQ